MKKFVFIIIPTLLICLLVYLTILYINNLRSQKGALQVTSAPASKVYLNNEYVGHTPLSKTERQDMLAAGNYSLRLVPDDKSLSEYNEKITITVGVLTVVSRKFGKDGQSEGSIISLSPRPRKEQIEIEVISFPSGSKIALDSNSIGNTPLLYKNPTESDHILALSKNGYKAQTIRVHTPKGYRLSIVVYLSVGDSDQQKPGISPSPSPTQPTPTAAQTKIIILDTPTGFLRVRADSSLTASQTATVKPGETYPFISEVSGWFKIKLTDGKTGWISSDYSKKQ